MERKPGDKASTDDESMKMLGNKWFMESDMFAPGLSELNKNEKITGGKKLNECPIVTYTDASRLLQGLELTRRNVVAKVAEFFDRIGMWESVKLQLKLKLTKVSKLQWDKCLRAPEQDDWKHMYNVHTLAMFTEYSELRAHNCSLPRVKKSQSKVRLLCLADATEQAGGVAVFAEPKLAGQQE